MLLKYHSFGTSVLTPIKAVTMFKIHFISLLLIASCQNEKPLAPEQVDEPETAKNAHNSTESTASTSGMQPRVVTPPGKKVRDENEAQPGILTDQQLKGMLRTGRDVWQKPEEVLAFAGVNAGDHVADVGCGAGYWTYHIATAVGKSGKIYAVDFDANAIDYLMNTRLLESPIPNLEPILSKSFDTLLPENSVDHAILVDVHFFKHPGEPQGSQIYEDFPRFYQSIYKSLKADGTLIVLEHKETYASSRQVTQAQIEQQLEPIGFRIKKTSDMIDRQYFMIFEKVPKD